MRGRGTRKRNVMRGGNLGNTFSLGAPILGNNAATVYTGSSCLAQARPMVSPPSFGGLPGMAGGGRRRKQRGGRYSFDLSQQLTPAAPWAGGIPQVQRIPPEAAIHNPLNPVQMGGVGGVDSSFYAAPTAGYSNMPSTWVGSTGAPSLLQTPYAASTTPPVCFKTGGGRRKKMSRRKKVSKRKRTRRN
jgi:hypothetical protein